MPIPPRTALLAVSAMLLLGACAAYRPARASLETARRSVAPLPEGPLSFETAVRLLVARHPELKALRAEALAVNRRPGPEPLFPNMEIMDGRAGETLLEGEVLSLLGVGPQRARTALARAVFDERVRALEARARTLVGELAEAFLVEATLRRLESPVPALDLDAYERAGLLPGAALAAGRAALAEARAEEAVVRSRLREARRRIGELLGADPGHEPRPEDPPPDWPALEPGDPERLLLARGDLKQALAAWVVADRDYYRAVKEQWPALMVGVGGNVDLSIPMQMVRVRLPLGAPAEARARHAAREGAWHRMEAAVQGALHEALAARIELEEAEAELEGAQAAREAARALLQAEAERARTDPQAFAALVLAAGQEVGAARRVRETSVEHARDRVRAARAAGWPSPAWMEARR